MLHTIKQMTGAPRASPMTASSTIPTEAYTSLVPTLRGSTRERNEGATPRWEPTSSVLDPAYTDDIEPTDSAKQYVYRIDEDNNVLEAHLSQQQTLEAPAESGPIRIQLFVYHVCNNHTPFPHLQMMMEHLPAQVDVGTVGAAFAQKTVGWMAFDEQPDSDQTRTVNACIEHILLTYPGNNMGNFEFKGWLLDSPSAKEGPECNVGPLPQERFPQGVSRRETVVGVFRVDTLPPKELNMDVWANLDEIMYQASWRGIPIDPFVTRLFHQYSFLSEIVDTDTRLPVPIPMSLYLCASRTDRNLDSSNTLLGGGTYTNLQVGSDAIHIEPTIEHPLFGNHWFFSAVPIGPVDRLQRYSVFVEDPLTHALFRDISTDVFLRFSPENLSKSDFSLEDRIYLTKKYIESDQGNVDGDWPVKSTFFHEGGVPIWCIRDRHAFTRM